MSTAIEFNNISKQYRLGLVSTRTLSHDLNRWWTVNVLRKEDPYLKIGETNDRSSKGNSEYVWALKDINFKVEQGDVVGIIGKNGAGKSTLLKLLSKVTGPTTGTIKARGRIGSLLEVGTGFHPEMTGRENIFMNGAILGMNKKEIQSKLDEIVDFSGCERYIDTPVKRYSSGMMVRLGFAVAAHLDPEILVVDEVLAVGDDEFQKKAIGKMKDVSMGEGRTVLFVSHNMTAVKKLCKTGVVLSNGTVAYTGDVKSSVDYYIGNTFVDDSNFCFDDLSKAYGNENIKIKSLTVTPISRDVVDENSGVNINIRFYNFKPNITLDVAFTISTMDDMIILGNGMDIAQKEEVRIGMYELNIKIPPRFLNKGKYRLDLWFGENHKYVLWGTLSHAIVINDAFIGDTVGILRTKLEYSQRFIGE